MEGPCTLTVRLSYILTTILVSHTCTIMLISLVELYMVILFKTLIALSQLITLYKLILEATLPPMVLMFTFICQLCVIKYVVIMLLWIVHADITTSCSFTNHIITPPSKLALHDSAKYVDHVNGSDTSHRNST